MIQAVSGYDGLNLCCKFNSYVCRIGGKCV